LEAVSIDAARGTAFIIHTGHDAVEVVLGFCDTSHRGLQIGHDHDPTEAPGGKPHHIPQALSVAEMVVEVVWLKEFQHHCCKCNCC